MSGHPVGLLPYWLCLRENSESRHTGKELDAERKRGCSVKFFPCVVKKQKPRTYRGFCVFGRQIGDTNLASGTRQGFMC